MKNITNKDETFKLPRIFVKKHLCNNVVIELETSQVHYLHNVLRRKENSLIRLFNGVDGEWLGVITAIGKKSGQIALQEQLLKQPIKTRKIHLIFTPIKKHRMDWLIEKAVELGTTDFHPVITQNTEIRKIKEERLNTQIFEAAEQCERLEIPKLHEINKLYNLIENWSKNTPILSCIERFNATQLKDIASKYKKSDIAVLIGPEGGFTKQEKEDIGGKTIPVSLGNTILRCETAVIKSLIIIEN